MFGIQMNPVFWCPVLVWLLYLEVGYFGPGSIVQHDLNYEHLRICTLNSLRLRHQTKKLLFEPLFSFSLLFSHYLNKGGPLKSTDSTLDISCLIRSFSWSFQGLITYVNVAIT